MGGSESDVAGCMKGVSPREDYGSTETLIDPNAHPNVGSRPSRCSTCSIAPPQPLPTMRSLSPRVCIGSIAAFTILFGVSRSAASALDLRWDIVGDPTNGF